jgi:hypothetical protein
MNSDLPARLRELARHVAQHEMGHYVVARLLGFRTSDVSIEIIGPMNGHRGEAPVILTERLLSLEDVRCYVRRRIQVLYAGALAETLPPGQSPTKRVNIEEAKKIIETAGAGAEQDFAKARELIRILRNIQYQNEDIDNDSVIQPQIDAINNELWEAALSLVEKHAELIIGLAANLADRVKHTKERVVLEASYLENLPAVKGLVQI